MLRFVPGLRFTLPQFPRRAAKTPQDGVRQQASGKHTECHQRQDDRQQHLTRAASSSSEIRRGAVITDKRLGHDGVGPRALGRERIRQQQRVADLGDECIVDIRDVDEKVRRTFEQNSGRYWARSSWQQSRLDGQRRTHVPGPARDLASAGQDTVRAAATG